jgi:hypothetical protein
VANEQEGEFKTWDKELSDATRSCKALQVVELLRDQSLYWLRLLQSQPSGDDRYSNGYCLAIPVLVPMMMS